MNGILNILKPSGMTSFDVVARVRGLLRMKKCGHAGTLDPLATGVLPVCIGRATKAIEFMMEKDKLYRAELLLGVSTDTGDSSGEVIKKSEVFCSDEEIEKVIEGFKGRSMQLPPMYSAIKVNGRKLYEMAREGLEVERSPRMIEIFSIDTVDIKRDGCVRILFDVHCSKGTYIRTLCEDIGEKLCCGGHMSFLLRKKAGSFDLASTVTLEELKQAIDNGYAESLLIGIESVFDISEELRLDSLQEKKLRNGITLHIGKMDSYMEGLVKVYGCDGKFFALGEIFAGEDEAFLKSRKFF